MNPIGPPALLLLPEPSEDDVRVEAGVLDALNAPELAIHLSSEVDAAGGRTVVA